MTAPTTEQPDTEAPMLFGFRGLLLPTNVPAGDGRIFTRVDGVEPLVRPLPLPLCAQDEIGQGHDGGRVVGRIEYVEARPDGMYIEGQFNPYDDNALKWARDLANGFAGGVSADMDMGQWEARYLDADGNEVALPDNPDDEFDASVIVDEERVFSRWRLCGGTLCSGPAFAEARLEACDVADLQHSPRPAGDLFAQPLVAAAESDGNDEQPVHTGGMVALIPSAEDAERFAVEGGDPAAELHLTLAYLGDDVTAWSPEQQQATLDAVRSTLPTVVDASVMGHASFNPGPDGPEQCAVHLVQGEGLTALRESVVAALKSTDDCPVTDETDTYDSFLPHMTAGYGLEPTALTETGPIRFDRMRVAIAGEHHDLPLEPETAALVAAAIVYPVADFDDPHLEMPTPITVTDQGRIIGHVAAWNTCHIGYRDRCETAPHTTSGYRYFHTGYVDTDAGQLPVGRITLGTGHADTSAQTSARAALAHYDDTGTCVGVVRCGEDEHGIWISGRVLPGMSDERVAELKRSQLSGDWRGINGSRELIAALCVNTAGFPIPRVQGLVAPGGRSALVAAGMVYRSVDDDTPTPRRRSSQPTPAEIYERITNAGVAAGRIVAGYEDAMREIADVRVDVAASSIARLRQRQSMRREVDAAFAEVADLQLASTYREVASLGLESLAAEVRAAANPPGRMPPALHRYWTKGEGLAKWAASPHPYQALVDALAATPEIAADMTPEQIKGLAANLYHDVKGVWPGKQRDKVGK